MTSFRFDIGPRGRKAARFINKVKNELQKAVSEERESSSLNQQKLATKLGVHRSVINRQLSGESNITLKSISDLAWALDREIEFSLVRPRENPEVNYYSATSDDGIVPVYRTGPTPTTTESSEVWRARASGQGSAVAKLSIGVD